MLVMQQHIRFDDSQMSACKVSNASLQGMETLCPRLFPYLDEMFPYLEMMHY